MSRYVLLLLFFWQSLTIWADNYTVGYAMDGSSERATLWITQNSSTSTAATQIFLGLSGQDSRALSIGQYLNQLFIIGWQKNSGTQQAYLWVYDLKNNKISSNQNLANSDSSANGIVWSPLDNCFYAAGYSTAAHQQTHIWKIVPDPLSCTDLVTNDDPYDNQATSISMGPIYPSLDYGIIMYCAGWARIEPSPGSFVKKACIFTIFINYGHLPAISFRFLDNTLIESTASAIVYIPDGGQGTIYIAGSSNSEATLWQFDPAQTQVTKSVLLPFTNLAESQATDLVYVKGNFYVSGYAADNSYPALWQVGSDLSTSTLYSDSSLQSLQFNYIKSSAGGNFPLFAGGGQESVSPFYIRFKSQSDLKSFIGGTSLGNNNGAAFDMLIDVNSPSNNIPVLLKLHKTYSMQRGMNR